jgi:hypothetical protein
LGRNIAAKEGIGEIQGSTHAGVEGKKRRKDGKRKRCRKNIIKGRVPTHPRE